MATQTRKVLQQSRPAASGVLYTTPAATDTVVSTIVVAETSGATGTFRICVSSTGTATTSNVNALFWDVSLPANGTVIVTIGLTLAAATTIVVASSTGTATFTAFGQENA